MDVSTAIAAVESTDRALGLIEKLLGKLRAQPDIAAVKLSAALDEIVKTYRVVDQALTAYASLAIDKYLKRWFEKAFNREEQWTIEGAFIGPGGLGDYDEILFYHLWKLAEQLEYEASDILKLVKKGRVDQARQSVWRTYTTLAARAASNGADNAAYV